MIRNLSKVLGPVLLATACATQTPVPAARTPTPQAAPAPVKVTTSLVLMGTTDVHTRLVNHDYYTNQPTSHGLTVIKPVIDSIRAANPGRTMLFDSGDWLQGNPIGYVYARINGNQPSPIIKAMNLLDYDAAAIGNHEFNYGLAHLGKAIGEARFPFVSANIFRAGTQRHAYTPYVLLRHGLPNGDSITIGVTGNTPAGVAVWDKENVQGILEFRDVVASVGNAVREMRARGADIVVLLSHGGFGPTSYDTVSTGLPSENVADEVARRVPGLDVIFLGHTHQELQDSTINGVLITQALNWGQSLAVATLDLERDAGGKWHVARKSARTIKPSPKPDRSLADSVRWEHERTMSYVNSKVGRATAAMTSRDARTRDVAILDFINDVQRRRAGTQLSAAAAFTLTSEIPAGDITIADVAGLYIYDNTLKAIRITGAQLKAFLEKSAEYYNGWPARTTVTNFDVRGYHYDVVSGVDYTIDLTKPIGQRITQLTFEGAPVRPDQSFTMAINNYRQSGGGGYSMVADAPVIYDRQENIRELIIEEVQRTGTIDPRTFAKQNWRIVPQAAADSALKEQIAREYRPAAPAQTNTRKRLRVVSTNDFHGNLATLNPGWANGRRLAGAATLTSYFRLERAAFDGPTLLLDGGDIMQGTGLSNLTKGAASVQYYNMAGYDAAAVGNHEFDWSDVVLRERMAQAKFPWLSANIVVAGTDTTPSWLRGTAMLERDGVRIGIIGLMTEELPEVTMPKYIQGLDVVEGGRIMDRWVPELRRRGADFVIVVAHEGVYCDEDATTNCRGFMRDWLANTHNKPDLVVSGHTHTVVRTRLNGVPVIQSWNWGQRYGVTDLERVTPDSVDVWIRGTPVPWVDAVTPDSAVARHVAEIERQLAPQLNRVITTTLEEIPRAAANNQTGRLIADAQRAATGTQIAFMNVGGVRAPIPAGRVTWGDLYRVQPFGNTLITMKLTGALVRDALEHAVSGTNPGAIPSGLIARFDMSKPVGSRLVSVTLTDGTPIRDDAIYTVTVSNFLATGQGDGFAAFGKGTDHFPTGIVDLDALVDYVQKLPQPLRGPTDDRMIGATPRG